MVVENLQDEPHHAMRCMEIWGGNKAERNAIGTPGLDIWVYSEPYQAEAHSGDVHYVSLCGGGLITRLIVADVSGHGESVAEFSEALRDLMRRNINSKTQKRLVKSLNRQFTQMAQLRRFATAIVATYLATTDRLEVCNAAHPRPLSYRASERTWSILTHESLGVDRSAMNLPLGVDADSTYDQYTIGLGPHDMVIFYTDALTEAMTADGEMLGEEGLLTLVRQLDADQPERLGPDLLDAIRAHRNGGLADDDVTVLVLHHNGGPPKRLSIGEKLDVYAKVFRLKSF